MPNSNPNFFTPRNIGEMPRFLDRISILAHHPITGNAMINLQPVPIQTDNGELVVYVSPVLLQSKEPPNIKSGPIGKLYLYKELRDEEYKKGVDPADLLLVRNPEKLVIYYGQDFSKYYLGSFHIDFEQKRYWDWEANTNQFTDRDMQWLVSYMFDPPVSLLPSVTIFTPTRPSDFNLGLGNTRDLR